MKSCINASVHTLLLMENVQQYDADFVVGFDLGVEQNRDDTLHSVFDLFPLSI